MQIENNSADLILDAYRRIQAISALLDDGDYGQAGSYLACGITLHTMMNDALREPTLASFQMHLAEIMTYIGTVTSHSGSLARCHDDQQVTTQLNQLQTTLSLLRSGTGIRE